MEPTDSIETEARLLRTVTANPYIPHTPTPKQRAFLALTCEEAFYGGSAGGGKSDALLMAALQYVEQPGYSAILFRRTYTDLALPGALMDRAAEWLSVTDARWEAARKTWVFPSGATLAFGYLEGARDHYRYQGAEFQYVGFDELTEFTEAQYRFLFSRLRRLEGSKVPLRMRAASNPGGVGHEWVRRRFLDEGESAGRIYIPARLEDNPYLDAEQYEHSLAQLDPVTRAQLRYGDWSARTSGGMFRREWFEVIEPDAVPAHMMRVRYWDFAASPARPDADPDWTAGALLGERDGIYYLLDLVHLRATPYAVESRVRQQAQIDGRDVAVYIEQEPGASGVQTIDHYRRTVLPGYAVYADKPTGPKDVRARPLSAAAQAGNVKLVRGDWIGSFLDEADAFPYGAHDDQVDAVAGAMRALTQQVIPMIASVD